MVEQLNTKRFWTFIEANVQNYHERQDVKCLKELQNYIDGHKSTVKGIPVETAVLLRNEIHLNLYQEAINSFVTKLPVSITGESDLRDYAEAIADIAYEAVTQGFRPKENSRETISTIIYWADEFTRLHQDTDWNEVEYLDTIYEFIEQKLKE